MFVHYAGVGCIGSWVCAVLTMGGDGDVGCARGITDIKGSSPGRGQCPLYTRQAVQSTEGPNERHQAFYDCTAFRPESMYPPPRTLVSGEVMQWLNYFDFCVGKPPYQGSDGNPRGRGYGGGFGGL